MGFKKPTETDLVRQCLELLRFHRIFAWRGNAGGGLRNGRPVVGNPEGTPDILASLRFVIQGHKFGVLAGIECKSATGRQRPAQKAWQKNAEATGARYWIIRDVKQLESALREEGVIK